MQLLRTLAAYANSLNEPLFCLSASSVVGWRNIRADLLIPSQAFIIQGQ